MSAPDKHVFVSYVREDSEHVDALCQALTAANIPFWRDKEALAPGASWKSEIRRAIQSGSLAFLACFSTRSTAKDTSYMNEEMNLAVDEFRRRPPNRTWLIPVRFDDCEVPAWELDNRRTLHDLNWSDLFGPNHVRNAVELVDAIKRVLGETSDSSAEVTAILDQAAEDERAQLMYRQTKQLLFDPTQRIVLDDMVAAEQRRVLDALRDDAHFPVSSVRGEDDKERVTTVVARANEYWALVEPLCWSLNVAARWADPSQLARWATALRGLANEGEAPLGGMSVLIELRRLPALLTTVTSAIAAVAAERWDNLKTLVVDPKVSTTSSRDKVPLLEAVWPHAPFRVSGDMVPNVLAAAATRSQDPGDAYSDFAERRVGKFHTPVSDWLHHILRPVFNDQLPDTADYDEQFDRAEALLGALGLHEELRALGESPSSDWVHAHWYGRAIWRSRHGRNPVDELLAEVETLRDQWPPCAAGLFDGSSDSAINALARYAKDFGQNTPF